MKREGCVFMIQLIAVLFFSGGLLNAAESWQEAAWKSGYRHFKSGQYLLSATQLSLILEAETKPEVKSRVLFFYAQSMYELGEKEEYFRSLTEGLKIASNKGKQRFYLLQSVLSEKESTYLDDKNKLSLQIWKNRQSVQELEKLLPQLKTEKNDLQRHFERLSQLNIKSPALAASMSALVPGLGQVYNGQYQAAAVAFALNVLFGATTLELASEDLPVAAIASGLIFSVTYSGNILSAYSGAQKRNNQLKQPIFSEMRRDLFPALY